MQSFYGGFAVTRDYSDEGGCEEESGSGAAARGQLASDVAPDVQQIALPQRQPTGGPQSFFGSTYKAQGVAGGQFQSISYEEFDDFGGDEAVADAPAPSPVVSRAPVSNGTYLPVASSREAQPNGASGFPTQGQPQPCSRQVDFRTVSFADWLTQVDVSGSLSRYLEAIEDSYDTVAQILKTYSASLPDPVDPQFFEDIEVTSADHKALFRAWFAEANGLSSTSARATHAGRANASAPERGVAASGQRVAHEFPPSTGVVALSREELRMLPFRTWLLQVDAGGSVLHYQETLESNYDTVAQVAKTYALPAKGGKVLDVQFFEDSGIASEPHRLAFARWFARSCDLSLPGDMSNGFAR